MSYRKRQLGFTLIELLVVMAIIMVLAGLLFPVFSQSRAKAHQTSCASNLRQCVIALRMYRDEWDDQFPPQNLSNLLGTNDPSPRSITGPEDGIWLGQLDPYLRSDQVMRCTQADWSHIDQINGIRDGMGMNAALALVIPAG